MDTLVFITQGEGHEASTVEVLRQAGWRVQCRSLDVARESLAAERPDLIIVDIPSGRPVRATLETFLGAPGMASVPFVALIDTEQSRDAATIGRLDDFAIRPLRPEELVARARRLVVTEARDADDCIVHEALRIDLGAWEISVDGTLIEFTYQEFQLLSFLAGRPGRAFTRDQLLAQVWGVDYYGGSRTVDIHVRRIRSKLGSPYDGCLRTIRNVGYKWSAAGGPTR